MREEMILPAAHLYASKTLSLEELALIETLGIGCHAVNRSQAQVGERALVIGAGPIGCTVMEFLRIKGVSYEVLDLSDERRQFAKQHLGASVLHSSNESVLDQTPELPTLIFDCTGNKTSMEDSFRYSAAGGKLIFVGLFVGDVTFHDPDPFHRRELTIMSSRNATPVEHRFILKEVEAGNIKTKHWVSELCPVDSMSDRFPTWTEPGNGILKAVVDWR